MSLSDWVPRKDVGTKVINAVKSQGLLSDAMVIAIMTGMQESSLRNLNYGDKDSLGVLQQRSPWGPASLRMDVTQSTLMFLNGGMGDGTYGLTHYNWKAMTPGQACQTVQRSAFPDAYQAHYDDAFAFVRAYGPPASPWVLTGNQYFGPLTGPADSISGMWYTDTDVQRAAIRKIQALIGVPQNGHFDALTIATVKKWELNHNLPADGIVTKSTWGALGI